MRRRLGGKVELLPYPLGLLDFLALPRLQQRLPLFLFPLSGQAGFPP